MAVPHDERALQRLADLVRKRRVELGMNKIDVARASRVTITTYNKIEGGLAVRDVTYGAIEPALGWARNTCRDILDGARTPTLAEPTEGAVISPVLSGDLTSDFEDAVQFAAISVSDDLTSAQIRRMKQLAVQELRKRGRIPDIDRN